MEKKINIYGRYIMWAKRVKKEHDFICEMCNVKQEKTSDVVCHHIIPMKKIYDFELIMDENNIMVLCHSCHAIVHKKNLCDSGHTSQKFNDNQGFNVGSMQILKSIESCLSR